MKFENYFEIFKEYQKGALLRPMGEAREFKFSKHCDKNKSYRLFHTGETGLFFHWRGEYDYPYIYRTLTDALDSKHTYSAQFSLNLSSKKPESYIRKAYKKIMWPPVLGHVKPTKVDEFWRAGFSVTAKDLTLRENGYLRMKLEVHFAREEASRHAPYFEPDEILTIDFPEGTYDWQTLESKITIDPDKTAYVGIWFEGVGYSGEVYIESPYLVGESGNNVLPDFQASVPEFDYYDWTAQYLSRKEWPEFRIKLNGIVVFEGEIFERCHRNSEWEIPLPAELLEDDNVISYELLSDYRDPLPYFIKEIALIEQAGGDLELVANTEIAPAGGEAYLLIKTKKDGMTVKFTSHSENLSGKENCFFEKAGLHGIKLKCGNACEHAVFNLAAEGYDIAGEIPRIAIKQEDKIITGTGDSIYIPHTKDMMEEFLSWYFAENLGNLITFRSTYRWTGARSLDEELWRDVARIMNEIGVKYVVMLDGRELPGQNTNPDKESMAGEGFLGWQSHERDGAIYYWGPRIAKTLFSEQEVDMAQRIYEEDPRHTHPQYQHTNYIYKNGVVYYYRDPDIPRDMKMGMIRAIEDHKTMRGDVPRQTGPSVMFKYFLMSGYDWVGAETMYTTMEPHMAFLRGANLCFNKKDMGVHHAMQWSTEPLDATEHVRRYRLALYVSYMQGATEINTEEGFWHLEGCLNYFTRFTPACIEHKIQQQQFHNYVASHTRSGKFHTPMALIHGRYDGWHAFGNVMPWGWADCAVTDAEKSWDLLRVFYPLSKPGQDLYIYKAPTDQPLGYHTGTPIGNIDAIPIESSIELYKQYGVMAFMGYNAYDEEDFAKIAEFVKDGGRLLLTLAHTTVTTSYDDVKNNRLSYTKTDIPALQDIDELVESSYRGVPVQVARVGEDLGEVIARTDDGIPLAVRFEYGKGYITLVNANAYPAHPAIREIYEEQLAAHMEHATSKEDVWAKTGDDVQFTVFRQEDGSSHVYFLAVDWYRNPAMIRTASLRVKSNEYKVELPFGIMIKAVVRNEVAAFAKSEDGEVLRISDKTVKVQGTGKVDFVIFAGGKSKTVAVDFANSPTADILIEI